MLRDKLFDETQLYARLEAIVQAEDLPETRMALPYMREKHAGQYRVPPRGSEVQLPYYAHPALMACQAYAMGVKDDTILATALLHDVCEDCDVRPEELPFSEAVQTAVRLLTKGNEFVFTSDLNAVMEGYFADEQRRLELVFALIDMRHPPSADDLNMLDFLTQSEIPYVVVLTKADKLRPAERKKRMERFAEEIPYFEQLTCVPFSAVTGEGTDTLREIIEEVSSDE